MSIKQKRILILNYEYPPLGGGAANATKFLLQELSLNNEYAYDLVTSSLDNQHHVTKPFTNVTLYAVPIGDKTKNPHHQSLGNLFRYTIAAYQQSATLMRALPYQGTHAFFGVPGGLVALFLKWQFGVPYLVSLRGSDVPGYSQRFRFLYPPLRVLMRLVWKQATNVVANSQGLLSLAQETTQEQKIGVIPNGVDTNVFYPDESAFDQEEVVITAGATRITERKGLRHLLEAVALLGDDASKVRVEIMGDGSAKESLEKLAKKLGIEALVNFLGRIDAAETPRYYRRAQIFVLPSYNEGMSNALLEALASGLPVVVTHTGGSEELVSEGVNGIYVATGSSESIRDALNQLLESKNKRIQFGKASRSKALERSWSFVAQEYTKLYESWKRA
jgi:glycosyltransferase involved in cell wall biosynthesis